MYSSDETIEFNIENTYDVHVTEEYRKTNEMPFTVEELSIAISQLPNNKTCGNDGLPIEFYKVFWSRLKTDFNKLVREIFKDKHVHSSALMGVINLIPKPQKNMRFLKHFRPITLCNSDYKAIEKALANRMEPALNTIISEDQRGFRKGKRISSNIRTIYELIKYARDNRLDAIILSLDLEKCFDKIEFCALIGSLKFFKFPQYIIEWVKILYTDFCAVTQNNGHFSQRFYIKRGVHQGGPCSSTLFLICAELLALALKDNGNIKGIPVRDILKLLGQYADDADIYLLKEQKSLDTVFMVLERFRQLTGFTLNYDKTTIFRIGSAAKSNSMLFMQKAVTWTSDPINVLGVKITTDETQVEQINYHDIIEKMKSILLKWSKRSMSLFAKIIIVNTLIASLFVYKMTVLPTMTPELLTKINKEISKFIWNGRRPKIKESVLKMQKSEGGAGLVDLEIKDKALKISWVKILAEEENLEKIVYINNIPELGRRIWDCNMRPSDVKYFIKDKFWINVFEAWFQFKDKCDSLSKVEHQMIWLNSNIRVERRPIIWKKAISYGLYYVKQLIKDKSWISYQQAKENFGLSVMAYNTLKSAIPSQLVKRIYAVEHEAYVYSFRQAMSKRQDLTTFAYKAMLSMDSFKELSEKWSIEMESEVDTTTMINCFNRIYMTTNVAKYRSFQYQLLHRALITNVHMEKWGLISSNLCTFCEAEKESYTHLFIWCPYVTVAFTTFGRARRNNLKAILSFITFTIYSFCVRLIQSQ